MSRCETYETLAKMLVVTASLIVCPSCSRESQQHMTIRVSGSDTMVDLALAWEENYSQRYPNVKVEVSGGGSGVGIAELIDGRVDIANASRKMKGKEIALAKQNNNVEPVELVVGRDALAVYVHPSNPLEAISIEELAEIYGDGGKIEKWSQIDIGHQACESDEIVRVSRMNSSGTYFYFREAVVGKRRDFKLGSIARSGSKDVVDLVASTPCAIGYSGMAYATPDVKMLKISQKKGQDAVEPTKENAGSGEYPIARPLFLYTNGPSQGFVKDYIDWILSDEGQRIVDHVGYVPVTAVQQ